MNVANREGIARLFKWIFYLRIPLQDQQLPVYAT